MPREENQEEIQALRERFDKMFENPDYVEYVTRELKLILEKLEKGEE